METVTIISKSESPFVIREAIRGSGYAVFRGDAQISEAFKFISGAMSEAERMAARMNPRPTFKVER